MAKRFRASTGGLVIKVWVRIPVMALVSLSKTTYFYLVPFTQGYKWVSARVQVDIVFEKYRESLQPSAI